MENLNPLENSGNSKRLKGREAVPVEEALAVQMKLIEFMTPPELVLYIQADESGKILDNLTIHWLEKYAGKFAKYCDLNADDDILMRKIANNTLSDKDFMSIREFLEQSAEDVSSNPFFTPEELQEFLEQNLSS